MRERERGGKKERGRDIPTDRGGTLRKRERERKKERQRGRKRNINGREPQREKRLKKR